MLIIALVLAAIGLAALVFAVVTSNAVVAWVCIGASVLGVLLLIVDALRERRQQRNPAEAVAATEDEDDFEDEDLDEDDLDDGDLDGADEAVADLQAEELDADAEEAEAVDDVTEAADGDADKNEDEGGDSAE